MKKKLLVVVSLVLALLVLLPARAQEISFNCPASIYLDAGVEVFNDPELTTSVAHVSEGGSFPVSDCTDVSLEISAASGKFWVAIPLNAEPATPLAPTPQPGVDRATAFTALGATLNQAGYAMADAQTAFDALVASGIDPTQVGLITATSQSMDGVGAAFATVGVTFDDVAGMGTFRGPAGTSSLVYVPTPSTIPAREQLAFAGNSTGEYVVSLSAALATAGIEVSVAAVVDGQTVPIMTNVPVIVSGGVGRFGGRFIHLALYEDQIVEANRIPGYVFTVTSSVPWELAIDQNSSRSAIAYNIDDFIPALDYVDAVLIPAMVPTIETMSTATPAPSATPVPTQPTPSATPAPLRPLPTSAPQGAAIGCQIGRGVFVPAGTRIFDDGSLKLELPAELSPLPMDMNVTVLLTNDIAVAVGFGAEGLVWARLDAVTCS